MVELTPSDPSFLPRFHAPGDGLRQDEKPSRERFSRKRDFSFNLPSLSHHIQGFHLPFASIGTNTCPDEDI